MSKKIHDFNVKEIHVSIGRTVNTGNFNSAKFDTGLTLTIYEDESVEEAWQAAADYAAEKLEELVEDLIGDNDDN